MEISVITPVYNAEKYLRKCVESALMQLEVKEVVLVEDCSPDNSLEIALQLAKEDSRVKVYQHEDKKNHGAGATRNLAIQKASCEYIAFLDADDFYLPNRFQKDVEIFEKYPDAEGVYSAIGSHYYSEKAKNKITNSNIQELTTITNYVNPTELVYVLLGVHQTVKGYFSGDGLLVKKSVFNKVGLFNKELRLSQDTHMWIKMASLCNLYAGEIEKPVSLRGVHEENRVSDTKKLLSYRKMLFEDLYKWGKDKHIKQDILSYLKNLETLYEILSKPKQVALMIFLKHVLLFSESKKHDYFYKKSLKHIFGTRIAKILY